MYSAKDQVRQQCQHRTFKYSSGTTVMLRGTVIDMSPAQPGTPAISDESMDTWMDYLQLQMPIDGIYHNATVKGVDVIVSGS